MNGFTRRLLMIAGCIGTVVLPCSAQVRVGGIIKNETRWTLEKSPYIVTRDILITSRGRLYIEPGVMVLITKPTYYDDSIPQIDHLDSQTVAIKVQGVLHCDGKVKKRISISSSAEIAGQCSWYGIVFDGATDQYCEMAFTDIAGACYAVTAQNCAPTVRNCVIEYNNVGVNCIDRGDLKLYNCVVSRNLTTGILLSKSNPVIMNCLLVYNRNNGVWCDPGSAMTFRYNCVFGNPDGNLIECDPLLGVKKKPAPNKKDSVDANFNLYCNPIFAGTSEDSIEVERDVTLKTDKSRVADTVLAKAINGQLTDSLAMKQRARHHKRYTLSKYSPCRNAGSPEKKFLNLDGSRNDMGVYGGQEIFSEK